jgi:hypothetical protein
MKSTPEVGPLGTTAAARSIVTPPASCCPVTKTIPTDGMAEARFQQGLSPGGAVPVTGVGRHRMIVP